MTGKNPNLVFGGLAGVSISNSIADAAIFGFDDILDFSFAVSNIIACTTDGSIFDEVADLKET